MQKSFSFVNVSISLGMGSDYAFSIICMYIRMPMSNYEQGLNYSSLDTESYYKYNCTISTSQVTVYDDHFLINA